MQRTLASCQLAVQDAGIRLADLDAVLAKVESGGGGALVCVPKTAVPGIGWLAYVKDPDGNIFGMMQADTKAA